jgi:phosphohistidine phosphatase
MRRLFLIRHAKAEPGLGQDDYERALTERGRDDARSVASLLAARDLIPDHIIHSGALRTEQTAEIFAAQAPRRIALEAQLGLYDATQGMLYARAQALPDSIESIAFVGHNPGLGELAASLAGEGPQGELKRLAQKFPTCAVAVIDFDVSTWEDIERKRGLLALYLTPAELETSDA